MNTRRNAFTIGDFEASCPQQRRVLANTPSDGMKGKGRMGLSSIGKKACCFLNHRVPRTEIWQILKIAIQTLCRPLVGHIPVLLELEFPRLYQSRADLVAAACQFNTLALQGATHTIFKSY